MKIFIFIIILCLFMANANGQFYNPGAFPTGSMTVEKFKTQYTAAEKKTMLENANIARNVLDGNRLGFVFTDPNTSSQILVCNIDANIMLFEYIKLLRSEITNLKQRLQAAGIP